MTIQYVILGLLSETPMTGYDLKKRFTDSEVLHWSGNNNQIYRALVELHNQQWVTLETRYQPSKPPRKIYTITDSGLQALKQWMLTPPDLPQFRSALLTQLTWADQLTPDEVGRLLAGYEEEVRVHSLMLREQVQRSSEAARAAGQNDWFKIRIAEHWISFYDLELDWVRGLRRELEMR